MEEETAKPRILALVRDLIFVSKLTTIARQMGIELKIIRDPVQLAAYDAPRLLVDLNLTGAIEAAGQWRKQAGRVATGYVSHVDAETASKAREAGIDRVLARSRFVELLPELLNGS